MPIDFGRDVRPLLAERCYACHGPDASARKAGLRLDVAHAALDHRTEAGPAIVPGDAAASALMARITAVGDERMPPAAHGAALDAREIDTLRAWISAGAPWTAHWSFVPPARPALPDPPGGTWVRNAIDRFVLARLEREGLRPAPEADRRTLVRRLSLDLTGLPPTPAEIRAYLDDDAPGAFLRVVDRLLASPHYGERMALRWLDLARYADTNGYSIDGGRHMWAWRDWVIDAYNANMPFDRFTVEQLAGDLLPEATTRQRVASGFNRNHMNTHEGGTIEEEYRIAYVVDRVNTVAQTWLGLTVRCAQCHDHKYDPISQVDYYRFFAYFNTITDRGNDGDAGVNSVPFIPIYAPDQEEELARLRRRQADLEAELRTPAVELDAAQRAWEATERGARRTPPEFGPWQMSGPHRAASGAEAFVTDYGPEVSVAPGAVDAVDGEGGPHWEPRPDLVDGTVHPLSGASSAWYLQREIVVHEAGALELSFGSDDAIRAWFDGMLVLDAHVQRGAAPDQERVTVEAAPGAHRLLVKIVNYGGPAGFFFDVASPGPPSEVVRIVTADPEARSDADADTMRAYFRSIAPELAALRGDSESTMSRIAEIEAAPRTTVMVMEEMATPRETHVLVRGRYDLPGARVVPGTPECLPPADAGARADRLGLARWIVDPAHPLTARVAVNGLWQMLFGTGLVRTSEDFGTRGELPSHPELMDWLAVEFVESGWDTKAMIRLLVSSAAYRQASVLPAGAADRDPANRLLARGPRFRLQAELVRDHALAVSGLLTRTIGGPSARPYQPDGLWREMSHFGSTPATEQVYVTDEGANLYRRSLYTIWKRTVPPPPMVVFDAPNRELCTVRRDRTNTPLQALVLLNETGFVEAARGLAERMLREGGPTSETRLRHGFELVTARAPDPNEEVILRAALARERERFRHDPAAADALLTVGASDRDITLDVVEHAAWTAVANLLLNLSESITKG